MFKIRLGKIGLRKHSPRSEWNPVSYDECVLWTIQIQYIRPNPAKIPFNKTEIQVKYLARLSCRRLLCVTSFDRPNKPSDSSSKDCPFAIVVDVSLDPRNLPQETSHYDKLKRIDRRMNLPIKIAYESH